MYSDGLQFGDEGVEFILRYFFDGHEDGVLFFEIGFEVFEVGFDVRHVDLVFGTNSCEFMHAFEFIVGDKFEI